MNWPTTTRTIASALLCAAALAFAPGCKDKEKPLTPQAVIPAGVAEFGTPTALDLQPVSGSGAISFDPERHSSINAAGAAILVYLADDGTGTIRLYSVRYDNSRNPIVKYFTQPQTIDANSGSVTDAKALIDPWGDAIVVWTQNLNSKPRLYARTFKADAAAFSSPALIDLGGENTAADGVSGFDVDLDRAGNAIISFFENPAAPAMSEAFGVFYDKAAQSYSPPDKLDPYIVPGHTIAKVRSFGGPPRQGYVLVLQDSDPSASVINFCTASRFSSESSLSAFNAVTRVNPPGYDDEVRDFTGVVLQDGDALFLVEQDSPISGYSRIYSRRYQYDEEQFESVTPEDLAPESGAVAVDFEKPSIFARQDGVSVALFRSASAPKQLRARVYDPSGFTWNSGGSTLVSSASSNVFGRHLFAFSPSGDGEAVFAQSSGPAGTSYRLYATRFSGSSHTFSSTARQCDLGSVSNGAIAAPPPGFSVPRPAGIGFDYNGRFLAAFTCSDGMLDRLFVNRGSVSDPAVFEGARPIDESSRSSLFSPTESRTDVVPGDAVLLVAASCSEGIAMWRQQEILGSNTTVRLYGNSYHGFNLAAGPKLTGAQQIDENREVFANSPVHAYAGTGTSSGAVFAFVQEVSGTRELFIRAWRDRDSQFSAEGLQSQDNGTAGDVEEIAAIEASLGCAWVFFLQRDSGVSRLYARKADPATGTVTSLPGVNTPLSSSGTGFGDVSSLVVTSSRGRALVAYKQSVSGGEGVFGLRISEAGVVTGPVRLSSPTSTSVGAPGIWASPMGNVLAVFVETGNLFGRLLNDSVFGDPVTGSAVSIESATGAIGAFDADGDGFGNFMIAFEQAESGGGRTVRMMRATLGGWEPGPVDVSPAGSATLDHVSPAVRMSSSGNGMIAYKASDIGTTTPDVSLFASTYRLGSATPLSAPQAIDCDGLANAGLDVASFSIAADPATGRGFVFFTQDAQVGAEDRNRVYGRAFELANLGSSLSVFHMTVADMSDGGASSSTEATLFHAAVAPDGSGFLVHGERLYGSPPEPTHLFARRFDAKTLAFDQATPASRKLSGSTANLSCEIVDSALAIAGSSGRGFLVHRISQTDTSTSATYMRLFANVYR